MIINTFPFLAFTSTLLHPQFAIDYHDGPSSPTQSSIRSEATAPEASSAAVMHTVQREKTEMQPRSSLYELQEAQAGTVMSLRESTSRTPRTSSTPSERSILCSMAKRMQHRKWHTVCQLSPLADYHERCSQCSPVFGSLLILTVG
ncbi:hypothetical protein AFLA70_17g005760 [Aspergillus flavus AF70]|nr:hypothetical protein AFLA70_17g005760 [Aspergillus flavus AF70]